MTDTIKGLNCKVEVALTYSTAVTNTSDITKAYPPVATSAAHGLANGTVGFWTVTAGMVELDAQAFMVNNQATNTFEMPGLDTTNYSTHSAATFQVAATWGTLAEGAGYTIGGGAADQLNDTRLTDVKTRNLGGLLGAQNVTIDVRNAKVGSAAMRLIERYAMTQTNVLVKISQAGTVLRCIYGVPSLPGEGVASGQLATGQFGITVPAFALKPNV